MYVIFTYLFYLSVKVFIVFETSVRHAHTLCLVIYFASVKIVIVFIACFDATYIIGVSSNIATTRFRLQIAMSCYDFSFDGYLR